MSSKNRIEQLYRVLLQRNSYNQIAIRKYYRKIEASRYEIQRKNISSHNTLHLPDIRQKINPCQSNANQQNEQIKMQSQKNIKIKQKNISQTNLIRTTNEHQTLQIQMPMIKQCSQHLKKNIILKQQRLETSQEQKLKKQSLESPLNKKIILNLNNIIFHNNSSPEQVKLRLNRNKKYIKRGVSSKNFMLCSTKPINQSQDQLQKISKKNNLLIKYISASIDNLLLNKTQNLSQSSFLIKVNSIPIIKI